MITTKRRVIEEFHDVCPSCQGSGTEPNAFNTNMRVRCRRCNGNTRILVKTMTRYEEFDLDVLATAVAGKLMESHIMRRKRA